MRSTFGRFHSTWMKKNLCKLQCTQPEMEVSEINWKNASNRPHKRTLSLLWMLPKNHSHPPTLSLSSLQPPATSQHLIAQSSLIKSWKISPDISSVRTNWEFPSLYRESCANILNPGCLQRRTNINRRCFSIQIMLISRSKRRLCHKADLFNIFRRTGGNGASLDVGFHTEAFTKHAHTYTVQERT